MHTLDVDVMFQAAKGGSKSRTTAVCGERIKQYRKRLGWTQEELARQSGYSDRLIRKAEGSHSLSYDTIQNLAQTLSCRGAKVSAEDLLSSPKKSVKTLLSFGFSKRDDIHWIEEIATSDCVLEYNGDPRVPFTGHWQGVEGLYRWLKLFYEQVVDKKCVENAVVVVDDEHGFVHMNLTFRKDGVVFERFNWVMRMRFQNSKICSVWVITDARRLDQFFIGLHCHEAVPSPDAATEA